MDITTEAVPPEYDEYREEVRTFIAANAPKLRTKQRNGNRTPEFPEDLNALKAWIGELHRTGFQPAGNPDLDPVRRRVLREELGAAGFPTLLGNTALLSALQVFGTDSQKASFVPQICSGEYVMCQLFSEPEAGSDLASLQTVARREGETYVVNGRKIWTTYGQWADYGMLLARTDQEAEKHSGISAFIMPMKQPGVQVLPMRTLLGTSDFNEVVFKDALIPASFLIGAENAGWRVTQETLLEERSAIFIDGSDHSMASPTKAIRELFELASSPLNGRSLIDESAWRYRLADLYVQAQIQDYNSYHVRTRVNRGSTAPEDAPVSKVIGSELNVRIGETALAMLGADSILIEGDEEAHRDGHWQDWFLWSRALMIGGGTAEVMRNIIAERGLGMPRV